MQTARERMLELSPLSSGESARNHFLAITLGSGNGSTIKVFEKVLAKNLSSSVHVASIQNSVSIKKPVHSASVISNENSSNKVTINSNIRARVIACRKT